MVGRIGPELVARLLRQLYRALHQFRSGSFVQAALGKAAERRLVAGGGGDIGTGGKVVEVHLADQLRLLDQHPRRPQRVIQVTTATLQLGRHRAVQHDGGILKTGKRIDKH
ncbi:hypothetical protein D3C85_1390120 [compost metagenome]